MFIFYVCRMLMPKKSRVAIYENLFKEGVMVAKKDWNLPKHPDVDVSNLFVIAALNVSTNPCLSLMEEWAWLVHWLSVVSIFQLSFSLHQACDFSGFFLISGFLLQISLCLKFSWKKRSSHQGKKEVACIVSKPQIFVFVGMSENPPKLNI